MTPGTLAKYEVIVEKDLERYSAELKRFRNTDQRYFDERDGLLPAPSSGSFT